MFSAVVRTQCRSMALKNASSLQTRTLARLSPAVARSATRAFSSNLPRFEEQQFQPRHLQRNDNENGRAAPLVYRKPMSPSKSVYIGNLPYSIDENELHSLFSNYGKIEDIRLASFPDGRMRGFAHVDFAELDSATTLVNAQLAEPAFINNRQLRIDYAPTRRQIVNPPNAKLFLNEFRGTQDDLHKAFADYADKIMSTQMLRDNTTGRLSGKCFVEFDSIDTAGEVLEKLNETVTPTGYKLFLAYSKPRNPVQN